MHVDSCGQPLGKRTPHPMYEVQTKCLEVSKYLSNGTFGFQSMCNCFEIRYCKHKKIADCSLLFM